MATTLEDLEDRLRAVEQELLVFRRLLTSPQGEEKSAQRGVGLLEQARRDKPRLKAVAQEVFARLGATGEAVPPETLRAMMAACGIKPADNLFSRGIMEMREE